MRQLTPEDFTDQALQPFERFRFDGSDAWPVGFSYAVQAETAIVRLYRAACLKIAQQRPTPAEWNAVLIGGNHLASSLIGTLGPDFAERFPPDMPYDEVREGIAQARLRYESLSWTVVLDMWTAWAAIMRAAR